MPTKHIDDRTAAELDELYVRCVTLTQQPVKEVEVLRLAVQKGISNIADDDILAAMSVKDSVWKVLADSVWNEVTLSWPLNAISGSNFDALAEAHSKTWQRFPSESCRLALFAELRREHIELHDPMISTHDELFQEDDFGRTDEDRKDPAARYKQLDADYRAGLPLLHGRLYSALTRLEQTLARHYGDRVSFTPDGQGDFVVQVAEAAQ